MIDVALTPGSISAIGSLIDGFNHRLLPALKAVAVTEAALFAQRLNENVKREFIAGTDKQGKSHNKTGYTLGTFHVEPDGLGALVIGEGAALLVAEGSKAHIIRGHPYLHFKGSRGWATVREVKSPGYRGDDYPRRAIEKTDLGDFSARVVGAAMAAVFLRSRGYA